MSQYNQDKWLDQHIFKGYKNGFFMDVGSHDGITINNTLYFENNHNWTGINIEPIKEVYDKLVLNRPNCVNINCAVCNNDGTDKFICNKGYSEMISGLKNQYDSRHLERLNHELKEHGGTSELINVITKKISTICCENNVKHINYLSIDVEGAEMDVILSIDFSSIFIDIIDFENNYPEQSEKIISYLENKDYIPIFYGSDIYMVHNKSKFVEKDLKQYKRKEYIYSPYHPAGWYLECFE